MPERELQLLQACAVKYWSWGKENAIVDLWHSPDQSASIPKTKDLPFREWVEWT